MTTSIPLRVFIFTSALKKTSEKGENWWRELRDIYFSMIAEKPHKIKVFQRWASKKGIRFRVLHLRPLGQLSVSIFIRAFFQKIARKFVGEKTGEKAKNIRFWDFLCWGTSRRSGGTKITGPAEISSQPRYDHFDTSPYDVITFILLYSAGKCKGVEKGDWQKSKTFRKKRKKAIDYFRLMW